VHRAVREMENMLSEFRHENRLHAVLYVTLSLGHVVAYINKKAQLTQRQARDSLGI